MRHLTSGQSQKMPVITLSRNYNVVNANRTLLRTWSGEGLDIILVTFNETARVKDVIERIYRFTKTPFNLIHRR